MSTALSTDMPTSAAFNAGPSLTPSPRCPTTCPFWRKASMIAAFCDGETLANTTAVSAKLSQLVRRQLRHLAAENDAVHRQADFVANLYA